MKPLARLFHFVVLSAQFNFQYNAGAQELRGRRRDFVYQAYTSAPRSLPLGSSDYASTSSDDKVWAELLLGHPIAILPTHCPLARYPTSRPTVKPSFLSSPHTPGPTKTPSISPTLPPSQHVTASPTKRPSLRPTASSAIPSTVPSAQPTTVPTYLLSYKPSSPTPPPLLSSFPTHLSMTLIPTPVKASQTVWEIIQRRPELSTFIDAIVTSKLESQFASLHPLTVFAATNTAFSSFDAARNASYMRLLLTDPSYGLHLESLVLNHATVDASYVVTNLTQDGLVFATLDGETTTVMVNSTGIYLDTFSVSVHLAEPTPLIELDAIASNGVLQEVAGVLAPIFTHVSLLDLLNIVSTRFSTLVRLLSVTGLTDTIATMKNITLIAPTNQAFSALSSVEMNYLTDPTNLDQLRQVLLYHFIPVVLNYNLIPPGTSQQTSSEGQAINVTLLDVPGRALDIQFNNADGSTYFLAEYGILYQIETVLIPPSLRHILTITPSPAPTTPTPTAIINQTLFQYINTTGSYSTFASVIAAASVSVPIAAKYTVFAPDNTAFQSSVGIPYIQKLISPSYRLQSRNLALYHFRTGQLKTSNLTNDLLLTMANGLPIRVLHTSTQLQLITTSTSTGQTPPVNVSLAETLLSNGALHDVDGVILPYWYFYNPETMYRALNNTFGTMNSLIEIAGLSQNFSTLLDSTIATPDNAAFRSTSQSIFNFLTDPANVSILREVLLYHVIPEMLPFSEINYSDYNYTTLQGENLTLTVSQSPYGGYNLAFNGNIAVGGGYYLTQQDIIYEISGILVPPSLVSVIQGFSGGFGFASFATAPADMTFPGPGQ